MNVKTFKRTSKRTVSVLLSVLMVLSLFTVCMVGTAVSAGAYYTSKGTTVKAVKPSTWDNMYLYIGHYSHVSCYQMTPQSGDVYSYTFPSEWKDYTGFFFAKSSDNINSSTKDKLWYTYRDIPVTDKSKDPARNENNPYWSQLSGTTTYEITVADESGKQQGAMIGSEGSKLVNATLYNYRDTNQVKYNYDHTGDNYTENHLSLDTFKEYNTAVSKWYENKNNFGTATPIYQGNFRQHKDTDEAGTIIPQNYFNFVSVANGANRKDGANAASTSSVAKGLVDSRLNANDTITQNGIEIPQFSSEFTETQMADGNGGAKNQIQTCFENLSFPLNAASAKPTYNENGTTTYGQQRGNTWYYYNARSDKNRYYDSTKKNFTLVDGVKGNVGNGGGSQGYYPFDKASGKNTINCFGTRFDIDFIMTEDGKYNGENLQFEFRGDDDVWVYIDGYLALDLGGSHNAAAGYINLNTMQSKITTGSYDATYNSVANKNNASIDYSIEDADNITKFSGALQRSLSDTSKTHKLTVFYLERGMFDSNFFMAFMLPQASDLNIEQKLDVTDVQTALQERTKEVANKDVFSAVVESNSKSAGSNNAKTPISADLIRKNPNDGGTTVLQKADTGASTSKAFNNSVNDESLVPVNKVNYHWTDNTSNYVGVGLSRTAGAVELLYDQTATFTNQFTAGSRFKVTLSNQLSVFGTAVTDRQPSTIASRLKDKYYTTTSELVTGSTVTPYTDGTETDFGEANDTSVSRTVKYINKAKVGNFSFTKKLANDVTRDANTEFQFKVMLSNTFGDTGANADAKYVLPVGIKYTIDGVEKTLSADDNGIVKLKVGQTCKISGIPVGTKFYVTEITSGNYSVDKVTLDGKTLTGTTLAGVVSDAANSGEITNTDKKTTVVYRYIDREVKNGLVTGMGTQYTYFTRTIAGEYDSLSADSKKAIKNHAPIIKNILSSYSLNESKITYQEITDDMINSAANMPQSVKDLKDKGKVFLATYDNTDVIYTQNFAYYAPAEEKGGTPVAKSTTKTGKFNTLIHVKAPADDSNYEIVESAKTNANGQSFLYWAKEVTVNGITEWTPVSTDYIYAYRITDNANFKAVYEGNVPQSQLDTSTPVDDNEVYHVTGEGSGYGAAAAVRIYDSYSVDYKPAQGDVQNQDRTRVNVVFGAVGSKDIDKKISDVGYILVKNKFSGRAAMTYADLSDIENLTETLKGLVINSGSNKSYQTKVGDYDTLVTNYKVAEFADGPGDSDYTNNTVNLTNKNRLNIVFDLLNTEETQKNYFTCYTYMVRDGKTYVSEAPANFSLSDAEPNIVDPTTTYSVSTTAYPAAAGTITAGAASVVQDGKVSFTIDALDTYISGGMKYQVYADNTIVSINNENYTLTQLQNGEGNISGYKKDGNTIVFTVNNVNTNLNVNVTFAHDDGTPLEEVKTVKVGPVNVTGGEVYFKLGGKNENGRWAKSIVVPYGATFTVAADPNVNALFEKWSDGGGYDPTDSEHNVREVKVGTDGSYSKEAITPVFKVDPTYLDVHVEGTGTVVVNYVLDGSSVTMPVTSEAQLIVDQGTSVTVTAIESDPNFKFAGWSGAAGGNKQTATFTVTKSTSITANFEDTRTQKIYFADTQNWGADISAYMYYKENGTDIKNADWPGVKMTSLGEYTNNGTTCTLYEYEIPDNMTSDKNKDVRVIFYKDGSHRYPADKVEGLVVINGMVYKSDGTTTNFTDWSKPVEAKDVTFNVSTTGDNGKFAVTGATNNGGGSYTAKENATVTITATPNSGYSFSAWTTKTGATFTESGNKLTFKVVDGQQDITVAASFIKKVAQTYTIKVGVAKWWGNDNAKIMLKYKNSNGGMSTVQMNFAGWDDSNGGHNYYSVTISDLYVDGEWNGNVWRQVGDVQYNDRSFTFKPTEIGSDNVFYKEISSGS